jgi:hypothetical protein
MQTLLNPASLLLQTGKQTWYFGYNLAQFGIACTTAHCCSQQSHFDGACLNMQQSQWPGINDKTVAWSFANATILQSPAKLSFALGSSSSCSSDCQVLGSDDD